MAARQLTVTTTGTSCNVSQINFLKSQFLMSEHVVKASNEDPLKKREQFAVSLRRQKTKQIISAKRRRLTEAKAELAAKYHQPNATGSGSDMSAEEVKMSEVEAVTVRLREQCLNLADPGYHAYYKFHDRQHFERLLQEISPGFRIDGVPVSKDLIGHELLCL